SADPELVFHECVHFYLPGASRKVFDADAWRLGRKNASPSSVGRTPPRILSKTPVGKPPGSAAVFSIRRGAAPIERLSQAASTRGGYCNERRRHLRSSAPRGARPSGRVSPSVAQNRRRRCPCRCRPRFARWLGRADAVRRSAWLSCHWARLS